MCNIYEIVSQRHLISYLVYLSRNDRNKRLRDAQHAKKLTLTGRAATDEICGAEKRPIVIEKQN